MTGQADMLNALEPTRAALIRTAKDTAAAVLAAADEASQAQVAAARASIEQRLRAAHDEGVRDAKVASDHRRRQRDRVTRQALLGAQLESYEELRRSVESKAQQMRADPNYPCLIRALTAVARDRLGAQATVTEHPSGGVVADWQGRHLDLSLAAFAERALAACPAEVGSLWQR